MIAVMTSLSKVNTIINSYIEFSKQTIDTVPALIRLIGENIEGINEVINLINLSKMKIYSKDGVLVSDNDINFLKHGDILYLDLIGKEFNFAQILDQYTKVAQLGLTGKVFKLKEIGTDTYTVIKMIYFGESPYISQRIEEFFSQIQVLKLLEHRNIVK